MTDLRLESDETAGLEHLLTTQEREAADYERALLLEIQEPA